MTLIERGKKADLELLSQDLPGAGTTSFTRQQSPLGLGHAVWCARELVGNEPFALLLPDVLVQHPRGCLAQMIDAAQRASMPRPISSPSRKCRWSASTCTAWSASASPKARRSRSPRWWRSRRRADAPSNLIITGRYILQPEIFDILAKQSAGAGGEIQLTDAMMALADTQPFYGLKFEGRSFDCGSKIGFLAANVSYGARAPDLAPALREEMRRLLDGK